MIRRLHFTARFLGFSAALAVPIAIALLLHATVMQPLREERSVEVLLEKVHVHSTQDLQDLFDAEGYIWPPINSIPRLGLKRLPPDLNSVPVDVKKGLFFRLALPMVIAENQRVLKQRELLLTLFAKGDLAHGERDHRLATRIAQEYEVNSDINAPSTRALLLRRVDAIPVAIALAQAADESAWGTSRFAREGNSLFGQWTWIRGEGLVPLRRAKGKGHLVRSFTDLREGVRAYFLNLNIGRAYGHFRRMRESMRTAGRPFDPLVLAKGLGRYSERGEIYIDEIRWLINDNALIDLGEMPNLR